MLEVRSLTKYYGHAAAVRGVSFTIRPGEILGLLGPNGAGKSTTVKMLTGLLEPSEGRIFYQGRSVHDDFTAFQRRLGYVPEEAHLYPHLTGREYLQLTGRLRGMRRPVLDRKMDEFLRAFGLREDQHAPLSSYSKGMRQKILLSAALLDDPEILVLDEPFSGLDVTSALMLRTLLRSLAARGKIVLYSSHVLEVVEKVCSDVVILRNGEVAAYDSIEHLRELMHQPSLEGVFAQLAQVDDGEEVAGRIVEAMSADSPAGAPPAAVAAGLRVYRGLASAFPQEFQNVYGPDLVQTGKEAIEPVWRRYGMFGLARLLLDIALHVPIEYARECLKDVRYSFRRLVASPGFTSVALISLALGIAIVTCAFSEMNGMALRSLPGAAAPRALVAMETPVSFPDYRRYRARSDLFSSSMAYIAAVPFAVTLAGRREREWGQLVTASYFPTLGVQPMRGSFPPDDRPANIVPVVVSYRFWQNRLAADPGAVGRGIRVNGQPAVIAAIAPKDFLGASPVLFAADLWLPLSAGEHIAPELAGNTLDDHDRKIFRVVGRLKPGVTLPSAETALDATARQIEQENGDPDRNRPGRRVTLLDGGKLLPLRRQDLPFFTSFDIIMSGLVMLIACANVANMMLARAARRRKEIALRLALGASRARIVRQLLTESMLVTLAAAIPAILVATWLMHQLASVKMPLLVPVSFDLHPDWHVLAWTVAFTGFIALLFGLVPAVQAAKVDLASDIRTARRSTMRNVLMVSQFAGSLTLLVIVGLLSAGIQTTLGMQSGFDPRNLALLSLDPVRDGATPARAALFFDRLLDRVQRLPGVTAACLTETVPVSIGSPAMQVTAPGGGSREMLNARRHVVGKDYFSTTGIPLLMGRAFGEEDEVSATLAVVVSQEFVREFARGNLLGRQIEIGDDGVAADGILPGSFDYRRGAAESRGRLFQVVGVVGDVSEDLIAQKRHPVVYFPLRQTDYAAPPAQGLTLVVRAAPGAGEIEAVRREIAALDADIRPFNVQTMDDHINQFMAPLRSASWTYRAIAIFGLLLSAVGLAGMTAYSVAQRTREIGIRVALGARRASVLRLVMKEGALLVATGTAVGMFFAWVGSRALAFMNSSVSTVTTVSTSDPMVLFGAPLLLGCLALIACYLPALESMRIDPVVALREE
ncbi:MAG TPA: ADOP family duplicated permease [Bryobacteraceae bacterium]|nr:ADOP family duplicated permease [Bryobacteraceae bacterium]